MDPPHDQNLLLDETDSTSCLTNRMVLWIQPDTIQVTIFFLGQTLRGHANSDFTKLETSKINKPQFWHILLYYPSLG